MGVSLRLIAAETQQRTFCIQQEQCDKNASVKRKERTCQNKWKLFPFPKGQFVRLRDLMNLGKLRRPCHFNFSMCMWVYVKREGSISMFFWGPLHKPLMEAAVLGRKNSSNNMHKLHKPSVGGMVTAIKLGKLGSCLLNVLMLCNSCNMQFLFSFLN